jgi:hypothetical protein
MFATEMSCCRVPRCLRRFTHDGDSHREHFECLKSGYQTTAVSNHERQIRERVG